MPKCETVTVIVRDEDGNQTPEVVMPAYTVDREALVSRVNELIEAYLTKSLDEGNQLSLGDFALFLIYWASFDPREV